MEAHSPSANAKGANLDSLIWNQGQTEDLHLTHTAKPKPSTYFILNRNYSEYVTKSKQSQI